MRGKFAILGVILAGGQSSRMGQDKALLKLGKKTLLEHIIAKFSAANLPIILSTHTILHNLIDKNIPCITDAIEFQKKGPLAGVLAALSYAKAHKYQYILTIAVDTPFIPLKYIDRLLENLKNHQQLLIATTEFGLQPTFALWPVSLEDKLHSFLSTAEKLSIQAFAFKNGARKITFSDEDAKEAFFNINTPQDFYISQNMESKYET